MPYPTTSSLSLLTVSLLRYVLSPLADCLAPSARDSMPYAIGKLFQWTMLSAPYCCAPCPMPTESDEDGNEEVGGVFDEVLQSYERQCEWMVTRLTTAALDAIRPLLDSYRKERYVLASWCQALYCVSWCAVTRWCLPNALQRAMV